MNWFFNNIPASTMQLSGRSFAANTYPHIPDAIPHPPTSNSQKE
jgi:hypothetical protein